MRLLIVVCFAVLISAQDTPKESAKEQAPKFVLSKEEDWHRQALIKNAQLIQIQIAAAQKDQAEQVAAFVQETLKAHGDPKNVTWDGNAYEFRVAEPKTEPKVPAKK